MDGSIGGNNVCPAHIERGVGKVFCQHPGGPEKGITDVENIEPDPGIFQQQVGNVCGRYSRSSLYRILLQFVPDFRGNPGRNGDFSVTIVFMHHLPVTVKKSDQVMPVRGKGKHFHRL